MPKLILEKAKDFELVEAHIRKSLDVIFEKEFKSLNELHRRLYDDVNLAPEIYIPQIRPVEINGLFYQVEINNLPFQIKIKGRPAFSIKEWPVCYGKTEFVDGHEVAKIRVIS